MRCSGRLGTTRGSGEKLIIVGGSGWATHDFGPHVACEPPHFYAPGTLDGGALMPTVGQQCFGADGGGWLPDCIALVPVVRPRTA